MCPLSDRLTFVLRHRSPPFSHSNQTERQGPMGRRVPIYTLVEQHHWMDMCSHRGPRGLPRSFATTRVNIGNEAHLRPSASPKSRTKYPTTPRTRTNVDKNAGACGSIANIHAPTRPLLCRGWKALGEFGTGGRTPCLWVGFEAGESEMGGAAVRDGTGLGTRRARSYMGCSEADQPVTASYLTAFLPPSHTPKSQRAHANCSF